MNPLRILVIIPAYNEEASLPVTIADIRTNSSNIDVLVVNDASTDKTSQVAKGLNVGVLDLVRNQGIGGAVQKGMEWAVRNRYDVAVQFDGDGQHQAKYIHSLIQPVIEGRCDLVIGSRYLDHHRSKFKTTLARRCGMILFSLLYRLLTGVTITDTTSGFRAYGRHLMFFFQNNYPTDFPDMPAILAAHRQGFKILERPVAMNPRRSGHSSTNLRKSFYYPFRTLFHTFAVYLQTRT